MEKKIYAIKEKTKKLFLDFCRRKATFYFVVLFGINGTLSAQSHDDDSIRVLIQNDFSVSILSSTNHELKLEVAYKQNDTITPLFVEFSVNGFLFASDCIQNQTINNINVVSNIEKIWGPEFVSLGLNYLPPQGRFVMNLATLTDIPPGSYIKVRIFGAVGGQQILWTGIVKK